MARVRVTAGLTGRYEARRPDGTTGPVAITPRRVRHWIDTVNRMTAEGIRIPAPWGHQLSALPADPMLSDSQAFLNSRYNAGYVVGAGRSDQGAMWVDVEAPGVEVEGGQLVSHAKLPDGTPVKTAIAEVSPMVGMNWKDGKGREWRDIVAHVALTPYPVQAGQPAPAALASTPPKGSLYLLAAAAPFAKDDDKDKDDDGVSDVAEDLVDAAETDPVDDMPAADDAADMEALGDPVGDPAAELMTTIKADLMDLGLHLGDIDAADPLEFLKQLATAVAVVKHQRATADATVEADDVPTTKTPPGPVEKPAPASIMASAPPWAKKLLEGEGERRRKDRLARIAALEGRNLPVATGNKLRAVAAATKLSLDANGDIRPSEIDRQLDLLDEALPGDGDPQLLLSRARPVAGPHDGPEEGAETDPEFGNDLPLTEAQKKEIKRRRANVGRS